MAKNFGSAGSAKSFENVAKTSAEKAQVIVVKMIPNERLLDYPKNHEDVKDTADLENSIKELGFTDPIEVTNFGMEDGHYMIVSGHRRRAAGVKQGMKMFPCIVRNFNGDAEVHNYVLLANSQRDSAKDPLLFSTRYKMHEEYLKEAGFAGNVREEIARRLGISVPQADRYNAMNKIITPVWDMVRNDIVGMTSVMPMASHPLEEQAMIYDIMLEALDLNVNLTRETMKQIVDGFRKGKRAWAEIADLPRDSGLPLNGFVNPEPGETREPKEYDRNDEVRREDDPIAEEADRTDAEWAAWDAQQGQNGEGNEPKEKKPPLSDEEKQVKRAKEIKKALERLNTAMSEVYTFESDDEAEEVMRNMAITFEVIVDELYSIGREHSHEKLFDDLLYDMKRKTHEYDE